MKKLLILFLLASCTQIEPELQSDPIDKELLVRLINKARTDGYGQYSSTTEITWSELAEQACVIQSSHMEQTDEFAHTWSDGTNFFMRLKSVGFSGTGGENIAWGQHGEEQIIEAWLNSQGHCKNIMNPNYNSFAVSKNGVYWCMVLIRM